MKNLSVTMLMLLLMFMVTNADAQRRTKDSKRTNRTVRKKVVRRTAVASPRNVKTTRRVVHKPAPRVRVTRTRVVHHNYRHLPRRGAVVATMPAKAVIIRHGGVGYRFHSGVWYRPKGTQWIVTRPSRGIRVQILPVGHRRVVLGPKVYYYYYGTYYVQQDQGYEVVNAPMGAEVGSLPDGYNVVTVNKETYYELDDIYYMPSLGEDGEEILVVVENPMS